MDWKQDVLRAFDEHKQQVEKRNQIEIERQEQIEARRRRYAMGVLKSCLKNFVGIEVEPTSERYTLDGHTFVGVHLGAFPPGQVSPDGFIYQTKTLWSVMKLEGVCPECGRTVLSPPIQSKAHLGSLIESFRAGPHDCIAVDQLEQ